MEDYGLEFRKELERAISQIPEGMVARLTDVADVLGDRRAVRAIAQMLPSTDGPFWRVVREDMSILNDRISKEIEVTGGKAKAPIFNDFMVSGTGILKKLSKEREDMRSAIDLNDYEFETIVGVDMAYSGNRAIVALSCFEISGFHRWDEIFETSTDFPYIPTYLSYREGPPILKAISESSREIEALMVDGNGILHPEHLGLASYIGIKAGIPSIGVAKNLLCGELRWPDTKKGEIVLNGKVVGYALRGGKAKNPVYVSPGNMISLEKAREITESFMAHRIPEPTRRAHEVAKKGLMRK